MKAPEILKAGQEILVGRAKEYDPNAKEERNMAQIVRVFNAFYPEAKMTEAQGWHFMAILKTVRGNGAPEFHKDSAVDGVNYMALMGEAMAIEKGAKMAGAKTVNSGLYYRYISGNNEVFIFDMKGDLMPSSSYPFGLEMRDSLIDKQVRADQIPELLNALRGLISHAIGKNPVAATRAERAIEILTNVSRATAGIPTNTVST